MFWAANGSSALRAARRGAYLPCQSIISLAARKISASEVTGGQEVREGCLGSEREVHWNKFRRYPLLTSRPRAQDSAGPNRVYRQGFHIDGMPRKKLTLEDLDAKLRQHQLPSVAELRRHGVTDEEIQRILTGEKLPEPEADGRSNSN